MQFVLFLAAGSLEKLKEVWLFSRKKKRRKRRDNVRLVFFGLEAIKKKEGPKAKKRVTRRRGKGG